jgi:hypothetical protein
MSIHDSGGPAVDRNFMIAELHRFKQEVLFSGAFLLVVSLIGATVAYLAFRYLPTWLAWCWVVAVGVAWAFAGVGLIASVHWLVGHARAVDRMFQAEREGRVDPCR